MDFIEFIMSDFHPEIFSHGEYHEDDEDQNQDPDLELEPEELENTNVSTDNDWLPSRFFELKAELETSLHIQLETFASTMNANLNTRFEAIVASIPNLLRREIRNMDTPKPRSGDRSFKNLNNLESKIDDRCESSSESLENSNTMENVNEIGDIQALQVNITELIVDNDKCTVQYVETEASSPISDVSRMSLESKFNYVGTYIKGVPAVSDFSDAAAEVIYRAACVADTSATGSTGNDHEDDDGRDRDKREDSAQDESQHIRRPAAIVIDTLYSAMCNKQMSAVEERGRDKSHSQVVDFRGGLHFIHLEDDTEGAFVSSREKCGTSSVRIQGVGEGLGCVLWSVCLALVCCSNAFAVPILWGAGIQVVAVRYVYDPGGTSSTKSLYTSRQNPGGGEGRCCGTAVAA